jgi:uncharacterized repeat protein (TIGR03803 family)
MNYTYYNIDNINGMNPEGSLIYQDGLFYGTISFGGNHANGTLFTFDGLILRTLYNFGDNVNDGGNPRGSLIYQNGAFYGTTSGGKEGTIFRFDNTITTFPFYENGATPQGSLIYQDGLFYGTTSSGGTNNYGTLFSLTGYSLLRYIILEELTVPPREVHFFIMMDYFTEPLVLVAQIIMVRFLVLTGYSLLRYIILEGMMGPPLKGH